MHAQFHPFQAVHVAAEVSKSAGASSGLPKRQSLPPVADAHHDAAAQASPSTSPHTASDGHPSLTTELGRAGTAGLPPPASSSALATERRQAAPPLHGQAGCAPSKQAAASRSESGAPIDAQTQLRAGALRSAVSHQSQLVVFHSLAASVRASSLNGS